MKHTVIGILADEIGAVYNPLARRAWSTPASEIRAEQANWLPIDRDHDGHWVGQVVHLERSKGNLWCVGEVDAEPYVAVGIGTDTVHVETPHYWSAERSPWNNGDIILRSVAITPTPARAAAQPLTWFPGDLDFRGTWLVNRRSLDVHLHGLLTRAAEARHRHGRPLIVAGQPQPKPPTDGVLWLRDEYGDQQPVSANANARPGLPPPPARMR